MKKTTKLIAVALSALTILPVSAQNFKDGVTDDANINSGVNSASLNSIISSLEGLYSNYSASPNSQINSVQSLSSANDDGLNGDQINSIQSLSSANNDGLNGDQINSVQSLSSANNDGLNDDQINSIQSLSSANNDGLNDDQIHSIQSLSSAAKEREKQKTELFSIITRLKSIAEEDNVDQKSFDDIISSLSNLSNNVKSNSLKEKMQAMQDGTAEPHKIGNVSNTSLNSSNINSSVQSLSSPNNDGLNSGINSGIQSLSSEREKEENTNEIQSLSSASYAGDGTGISSENIMSVLGNAINSLQELKDK